MDSGTPLIPIDPLGLTLARFECLAQSAGYSPDQALQAYRRVFREGSGHTTRGQEWARPSPGPIQSQLVEDTPEGPTVKFLQRVAGVAGTPLADRIGLEELSVESVLIPMIGRLGQRSYTLCVSSQVGCALGCAFCETAQMGFIRNLTPAEIVAQWFAARHLLDRRYEIRNLVFMGMGEPMDNLDAVLEAIRIFCDNNGPALGASNITVSTVGRIDGIGRLASFVTEPGYRRLGLSVSINAPNDEIRSQIMPINRAMPMDALRSALLEYPLRPGGKICFEYVLIPGINDAPAHADELAEYLAPFGKWTRATMPRALVNVIPYNPRRNSPWPAPSETQVNEFVHRLAQLGVYVKRRRTKGRTLMGACGQLGAEQIRSRRRIMPSLGGVPIA